MVTGTTPVSGKFFQQAGAKIVVGRGDEAQATAGKNDEMSPTSAFAVVLKPFVKLDYDPFTPDVFVEDERKREAIVGDQILGGVWGGMLHARTAGEHYYQLDAAQNRCNIQALLARGIEHFQRGTPPLPPTVGPVDREAVLEWRKGWPRTGCPR
jgi:hypothetical protein